MPASLAIHALRARTPARAQPVAARLALQALGADLEDALPRGLPPQALLWLRRLQLQAPEAALLRPAPTAWRQDWIATGRERFDAALAQAARPALGPVPESAPAVLFADAAEMLACLALAAQAGQLDRWWWRGLLGRAWPQWQHAWAARPEAQAGAQRLLAKLAPDATVAASVPPARMALPALTEPVRESRDTPDPASPPPAATPAASAAPHVVVADVGAAPCASLPANLPLAATAALRTDTAEQAIDLHAPPALVVQPAPSTLTAAPVIEPRRPSPSPRSAVAPHGGIATPVESPVPAEIPTQRQAQLPPGPEAGRQLTPDAPAPPTQPWAGTLSPTARPVAATGEHASVVPPAAKLAARDAPRAELPGARAVQPATVVGAAALPAPLEPAAAAWPWPQALPTRQAPLLFIVNALLEDGLYPDFTRPRDPGLPVPLWALLGALATAWRLPAGDPLQAMLAEHGGDWAVPQFMPAAPGAAAGPWPTWLAAYARALRQRLCRRLARRTAAWPSALSLDRPARLWHSEAEWVVEFDLQAHDVAWRLAGLDRDPGWLPSAGCSLRFVFA